MSEGHTARLLHGVRHADHPPAFTAAQAVTGSVRASDWITIRRGGQLHAAGDLEQVALYLLLAADQAAEALAFHRAARLYREALAIQNEIGATAGPPADTGGVPTRLGEQW